MIEQFGAWLATPERGRRIVATTIHEYQRQVQSFALWLQESLGLPFQADTVTPYRLEHYLQYLQTVRKLAPATQAKAAAALGALSTWLRVSGQRADPPPRPFRTQPQQAQPPKALAPVVVRRVLDAAHHTGDLRDALVVEVLAKSGMRASEVAGMQIEDLERGARTTWIRIRGKGQKVRRVPVPKAVSAVFDAYLEARALREGQHPTSGPVLIGQRGRITRGTINQIVAQVARQAKLTPAQQAMVTPHSFRHTVATLLVRQRDLVTVADLLGHANVNTTRRYAKASASELEDTVELLRYDEEPLS